MSSIQSSIGVTPAPLKRGFYPKVFTDFVYQDIINVFMTRNSRYFSFRRVQIYGVISTLPEMYATLRV